MRHIYHLREKIMNNKSKCEMARLRYCQKSYFGYCNADDTDVEDVRIWKQLKRLQGWQWRIVN